MDDLFSDTDTPLPEEDRKALRVLHQALREVVAKPRVYEKAAKSHAYLQRRIEKLKQERDALMRKMDDSESEDE